MTDISSITDVVVDGYKIERELRQVQMVELDLLKELMRVCKKHGLRLWADSGTLLGAVRHKGFIPWDNDIDVAMPRPDYDKLVGIAPTEFHHPYFFQDTHTDPLHGRGHAQLRNSNTTAIFDEEYYLKINHGIFLDIFPLDGVPESEEQRQACKNQRDKLLNILKLSRQFHLPVTWNPMKMLRYAIDRHHALSYLRKEGISRVGCFARFEDLLRSSNYETSSHVGTLAFWYRRYKIHSIYDDTVMLPFEDTMIPAPADYDSLLRIFFGDNYMTPMQIPSHDGIIFDPERPYQEVQAELLRKHSWVKDFWSEIVKRIKK